jgi:carbon monoxide dehydrogenase subunit G
MKMMGERIIPAPRERVWAALNDPEVLRQAIPGCQEMTKHSPTEFEAKVVAKVGPVKANFVGNVRLSELNPPESYVISGEGKGGVAGFAKGGSSVRLDEQDGATRLTYDVDAQVGGKLAQIGSRLIDSTARKMADDFFSRFASIVAGAEPVAGEQVTLEPKPAPKRAARKTPAKAPAKPGAPRPRKAAAGKVTARGRPQLETDAIAARETSIPPAVAGRSSVPPPAPAAERPHVSRPVPQSSGVSSSTLWWMGGAALVALIIFAYLLS